MAASVVPRGRAEGRLSSRVRRIAQGESMGRGPVAEDVEKSAVAVRMVPDFERLGDVGPRSLQRAPGQSSRSSAWGCIRGEGGTAFTKPCVAGRNAAREGMHECRRLRKKACRHRCVDAEGLWRWEGRGPDPAAIKRSRNPVRAREHGRGRFWPRPKKPKMVSAKGFRALAALTAGPCRPCARRASSAAACAGA